MGSHENVASNAPTSEQLLASFDELLQPQRFADYAPNGLQVEGRGSVRRLVSGVTASLALIEAAVAQRADALLVHHGLFWRGQSACVTGWLKKRLALLLQHGINLYAYHLPLDAHPNYGNNARLGMRLGLVADAHFGEQALGCIGSAHFVDAQALATHVERTLARTVVCVPAHHRGVRRVAWCSGGAQGYFESAIAAGADAFITGEISEPQAHYAREMGVAYIACGHHASERYGAAAVAEQVAGQWGIEHCFIDIDNPA